MLAIQSLRTNYPLYCKEEAVKRGLDYYWDEAEAYDIFEFFETALKHSKGEFAGKPFQLLKWQRRYVSTLLCVKNIKTGLRKFRTSYLSTAKKNGKSTLLAAIAIYLTIADREPAAEVYSVAADVSQASIVFKEAELMCKSSNELSQLLDITPSRRNIAHLQSSSFYRVLPGDGFRVEGINAHAICFDELHTQRSRQLYDALKFSGSSRKQPVFIATTTAGFDKSTICGEMYDYAVNVTADPSYDPTFLPFICEAAVDDDWSLETTWEKANPSLGHTIPIEAFRNDFLESSKSTVKENAFRRYRINQWVQQENRFINMDQWTACNLPPTKPLEGRECWMGIDLATTWDMSAAVLLFPDEDGTFDILCRFWMPQENLKQKEQMTKLPYTAWLQEKSNGFSTTPGDVTDYDFIRKEVVDLSSRYNIRKVLIDRWNATQFAVQLSGDGLDVLGYAQSFATMSAPTALLENLIISGKLRHNGNKILTSMAGAVSVKTDPSGNIRPIKPKHGAGQKIDGIIALVMAIGGHSKEAIVPDKTPEIIVL